MYHIFFIYSSVDGHLGFFHILAVVNSTAANITVYVSFWIVAFSGYMPRNGIAGSYGSFIPSFLRNLHTVLQVTVSIYIPKYSAVRFPFLHTLFSTYCLQFFFFNDGHSDWCEVIHHRRFDLHLSNNEQCWASFHMCIGHVFISSLEKEMAPHSSTLAWRMPWMEEPGGLQSTGSQRVGHDWAISFSLYIFFGEMSV